jgi:hypothetical protein
MNLGLGRMKSETNIHKNNLKTHHGKHTPQKQLPKSNNTFDALWTIQHQNKTQYCTQVQGHSPNNPNFPSRNRKYPPTILDPKNTASWGAAERQMTTRKVCCSPRKAAAGEGRKPGKTQTTCATGKGKSRRGNRGRRHTAITRVKIVASSYVA